MFAVVVFCLFFAPVRSWKLFIPHFFYFVEQKSFLMIISLSQNEMGNTNLHTTIFAL